MNWLRRLERRLAPFAIPNLTQILIAGQVVVFLLMIAKPDIVALLEMRPSAVLQGEAWRLFTFLFVPGVGDPTSTLTILFFIMGMIFLHLMGGALESNWGAVRYNVFILVGYLASIGSAVLAGAVLNGEQVATNLYLYGSIFLAFAYLYPDYQILIFFILPVKVKWIALLTVAAYVLSFLGGLLTFRQGGWLDCVLILSANLNLFLFFGRDMAQRIRSGNRRMARRFEQVSQVNTARHVCIVCGATELTHPDREFRYCTQCEGTPAYCNEHLAGHQHRTASNVGTR